MPAAKWAKPMVNACCVGSASRIASASYSAASANRPSSARLMTSQVAIVDRWRCSKSERLVDPVGGQRREVAGGQLDHPLVLAPEVDAPARDSSWRGCGVSSPRGARRSPARGCRSRAPRPARRAASGRCVMNAQTRPRRRSSFNRSARASASRRRSSIRRTSPSWLSTGRSSRRISKACSSVDWLSGSASRSMQRLLEGFDSLAVGRSRAAQADPP